MIVLMVTLFQRVTMRRSTLNSASFSLLKATSAGALVLAFVVACSDSNGPRVPKDGIPVEVQQVAVTIPDSVKEAESSQFVAALLNPPRAISANGFAVSGALFSRSARSCGSGGGSAYTVETVPFIPEPIPIYTPAGGVTNDGYIVDLPLEFNFAFFGNTYNKVNIYANGFLRFSTPEPLVGYAKGNTIPLALVPNDIIAFAWADWEPENIPGAIRFETRGHAPDRMFILQFNNVPEWSGKGLLMSQLVLHEGSNAITMYTNTLTTTKIGNRITQGIENAAGDSAFAGDSVLLPSGIKTPRIKAVFTLTNDAIRFTPLKGTADTEVPVITAPANIEDYHNDPGLGSAAIASIGSPEASDNCALQGDPVGVRSDGAALDAPYPVGVTTITWTAKDAAGNVATASQSVEVIDVEDPIITFVPANFSVNATSSLGAFVSYAFTAQDNVGVTSQSCVPAERSTLPIGANEVTCSASDAAGHTVSRSFVVTVVDAPTQMMNLIEYVISRGMPNGMTNPLVNELQQAFANAGTSQGCKKMSDFLSMVEVKGVPGAWADYMFSEAQRIMTVMQCQEVAQARRGKLKGK